MSDSSRAQVPQPENAVTVLVVNPLEDDRVSLRHILGHSNWRVNEVPSLREAMAFLRNQCASVVVCERHLPDGDWQTLLDAVAKLPRPPRLIVSSRIADDLLWAEVLNLGGYDVLPLPFEAGEVFRVIHSAWLSWKHECDREAPKKPASSETRELDQDIAKRRNSRRA